MSTNFKTSGSADSDKIKAELLSYRGLCLGGCYRRVDSRSSLLVYMDEELSGESVYYYLLCLNCVSALNKSKNKDKIVKKIEKNLKERKGPYASLLYIEDMNSDDPIVNSKIGSKIKLNKLNLKSDWVLDDKSYFEENPNKRFRYRKLYEGEIEDIEALKNDVLGYISNTKYVIVHKITNVQMLKALLGGEVDENDLMDELYINALFIVMALNMTSDKVKEVYDNLVKRNEIWSDFDTFKFNYS